MKTRIPELRRERKISQEELAKRCGVSRQTVIRAALLFMMRAKHGEKSEEEEL